MNWKSGRIYYDEWQGIGPEMARLGGIAANFVPLEGLFGRMITTPVARPVFMAFVLGEGGPAVPSGLYGFANMESKSIVAAAVKGFHRDLLGAAEAQGVLNAATGRLNPGYVAWRTTAVPGTNIVRVTSSGQFPVNFSLEQAEIIGSALQKAYPGSEIQVADFFMRQVWPK